MALSGRDRAFGATQLLRLACSTSARLAARCCFAASSRPARLLAAAAVPADAPPRFAFKPPGSAAACSQGAARVREHHSAAWLTRRD